MITNDQVRALVATDRAALVELLAMAYQLGGMQGTSFDVWKDPDVRDLIDAVRAAARIPQRSYAALDAWNQAMRGEG